LNFVLFQKETNLDFKIKDVLFHYSPLVIISAMNIYQFDKSRRTIVWSNILKVDNI